MSDSTNADFPDTLVDHSPESSGYPDDLAAADTVEAIGALGNSVDVPDWIDIPRDEWKDAARENDKHGTWPDDYRNRETNQSPTHECTCHALVQACEIAYNRQRQGAGQAVWLSPLSVYSEANPREWGGATMQGTLRIALERGILPEHNGPDGVGTQKDRFRHTLNCSSGNVDPFGGPWVPLRRFPNGWKDTAKHFRPLEVANPRTWQQIVCLVLNGYPVAVGRRGHAIPYVRVVWRGGSIYLEYMDSYQIKRYDSLRNVQLAVGGSYSPMVMAAPSDWNRPANIA